MIEPTSEYAEAVTKLTKDLKAGVATLGTDAVRFLVDAYYMEQRDRIRLSHQVRALEKGGEPSDIMDWLEGQRDTLERQIASVLRGYTRAHPCGAWMQAIVGIGPIISAGILAHIDITKAPTVGHIWRYAGLDPTVKWKQGQKRPWNGALKRLMFIAGECFVKVSNNEKAAYGNVYACRKQLEVERNSRGDFAEQAARSLQEKRYGADTVARKHYEEGRLPPARIHLRAHRYAVKLFMSHVHCAMYFEHFGRLPPKPYVVAHMGHAHLIAPPNMHLIPGLAEAWSAQLPG